MKKSRGAKIKVGAAAVAGMLVVAWILAPSSSGTRASSHAGTEPADSAPQPAATEPSKKPDPPSKPEEPTILSQAEVVNMVKILRTAIQKRDSVTREAMIVGLRDRPDVAERVLKREIDGCGESKDKEALRKGLEEALAEILER